MGKKHHRLGDVSNDIPREAESNEQRVLGCNVWRMHVPTGGRAALRYGVRPVVSTSIFVKF